VIGKRGGSCLPKVPISIGFAGIRIPLRKATLIPGGNGATVRRLVGRKYAVFIVSPNFFFPGPQRHQLSDYVGISHVAILSGPASAFNTDIQAEQARSFPYPPLFPAVAQVNSDRRIGNPLQGIRSIRLDSNHNSRAQQNLNPKPQSDENRHAHRMDPPVAPVDPCHCTPIRDDLRRSRNRGTIVSHITNDMRIPSRPSYFVGISRSEEFDLAVIHQKPHLYFSLARRMPCKTRTTACVVRGRVAVLESSIS